MGIGWLVAGRVLGPLRRVTETAQRIAAADAATSRLHERIALRGPDDEVKELSDAFDTMVSRLDHSFDSQRRFVANASHELRTPLTVNRVLIELAMHRKNASNDVMTLGENLLRINADHEQLINGLLLLTRAGNRIAQRCPVDLADLVTQVSARCAAEAEQAGVQVVEEPGEAVTVGDPVLLDHMVQNLMSNAVRHNLPDGGFVRIASRVRDANWVEVEVSNSGPAVAAFEVPTLFEPFRRLRTDKGRHHRLPPTRAVGPGSVHRPVRRCGPRRRRGCPPSGRRRSRVDRDPAPAPVIHGVVNRLSAARASPMIAAMATTRRADMFIDLDDDPRENGPTLGDERTTLVEALRCQRLTLEMKCSGLDAEAMARRSVEPSTMSLLGLVRHLAEMERADVPGDDGGAGRAPAVLLRHRP